MHVYEERYDSRGEKIRLRVGVTSDFEIPREKSHRAALVLCRDYDYDRELLGTDLQIRSKHIIRALQQVIRFDPDINFH